MTMLTTTPGSASKASRGAARFPMRRLALGLLSVVAGVLAWQVLSMNVSPIFLPSPVHTWASAMELAADGTLFWSILASSGRILAGWGLGVLIGVPVGMFMGRFAVVRELLDPYIEFFRFIPPIALVTLAIIWLGPGEASKIALIFYTTVFIVTLNVIAGVHAINPLQLRAATSLGASPVQVLTTVILPSTVPYMVTGARIAMGNSFLTVIAAEIVASQNGLGALIWTSRNFGRTEWVFVGIITLGLLGYLFDWVLRVSARSLLRRYKPQI